MSSPHQISVAVGHPPFRTLTYLHNSPLQEGVRVQIPMRNLACVGVVVKTPSSTRPPRTSKPSQKPSPQYQIRPITKVLDDEPVISPIMMTLAHFLSKYYIHPLGDVLRTMLPGPGGGAKGQWIFHYHRDVTQNDRIHEKNSSCSNSSQTTTSISDDLRFGHDVLKTFFRKKTTLTHITYKKHLQKLAASDPSFNPEKQTRLWIQKGYISKSYAPSSSAPSYQTPNRNTKLGLWDEQGRRRALKTLTKEQKGGFDTIKPDLSQGFTRPILIHGITGSGKTELYLHLIHEILVGHPEGQILVMVPEISLTPQITKTFERVLGPSVAMVHSAMPSKKRWEILTKVRRGDIRVLIGPRSSVFAPFAKLRFIVIDEEHDSSYKQSTGLQYHGRDVAIYRARLQNCPIVLGSATPSLESYYHTTTGKYALITLRSRVAGAQLPQSSLELSPQAKRKGHLLNRVSDLARISSQISPFSEKIIEALAENHRRGFQSMVMVQRRGHSNFLLDFKTQKTLTCEHCSISLTVHLNKQKLLCHYCDYEVPLGVAINNHDSGLIAIGFGSEKASDLLQHELPQARIQRLDSDLPSIAKRLPEILEEFKKGEIDILVGTQMIAKGHDFPRVTLTVLIEVDDVLRLPDFRAGERAFQLIVQASGRAGRGKEKGEVIIQSSRPYHPVIKEALSQNYERFYKREIGLRQLFNYPPFTKIILIEYSHTDLASLDQVTEDLREQHLSPKHEGGGWALGSQGCQYQDSKEHKENSKVQNTQPQNPNSISTNSSSQISKDSMDPQIRGANAARILGPATPPLAKIKEHHRQSLLLISPHLDSLHNRAREIYDWLLKRQERVKARIDVDPQHLL